LWSERSVWHLHNDAKHILTRPKILTAPLQVIEESSGVSEERLTPKARKETIRSLGCDARLLREGDWCILDYYLTDRASPSGGIVGRSVNSRGLSSILIVRE
jgi:hypothetical protein